MSKRNPLWLREVYPVKMRRSYWFLIDSVLSSHIEDLKIREYDASKAEAVLSCLQSQVSSEKINRENYHTNEFDLD